MARKMPDGTFNWSWQPWNILNGDPSAMIKQAKDLGLTGVYFKYSDGNLVGDPVSQRFMDTFKKYAPLFRQAGLKVIGWTYQYLTDVDGEIDALKQAVAIGVDGIVLDAEEDVAGKTAQVQQYGQKLRVAFPDLPVGLSSYAVADYHKEIPFDAYNTFVDVMMPQMYWADIGWDVTTTFNKSLASFQKYNKPIAPTGQAYDIATPADIAKFVQLCKGVGHTHISWWDWQHMTAEHLSAIKANLIQPQSTTQPQQGTIKDVPDDAWYSDAAHYVLQEGIMSLDENSHFNPDQPVTRSMLAQVIYNTRHQKQ